MASLTGTSLYRLMYSFKNLTSQQVNHMPGRRTPLWQSGYHEHVLHADADLLAAVDYCLRDPVHAGLVEDFRLYPYLWCRWLP